MFSSDSIPPFPSPAGDEAIAVTSAPPARLQQYVALAPYTTFGIGGPARWFLAAQTEDEIAAANAWARAKNISLFVLGGGSNVLVSDLGFNGLVLQIALRGTAQRIEGGKIIFSVAAGEDWDELVSQSVALNCAGIECLAGIPGTVGGTPVQNVGAYGQEVSQTITAVCCLDRLEGRFVTFAGDACGFAYRRSRFNEGPDRGRYIVTRVDFALTLGAAPRLDYADLRNYFATGTMPTLAETSAAVRAIRAQKAMVVGTEPLDQRDPDTRSAGSFFKNPIVPESSYQAICAQFQPGPVPSYPAPPDSAGAPQRKLPAAWLLEHAGFAKGFRLGGAALSSRHTLALTNHSGHASAQEILKLRDTLVAGVESKFGVRLQAEPVFVE